MPVCFLPSILGASNRASLTNLFLDGGYTDIRSKWTLSLSGWGEVESLGEDS
jgi:hypothetical protein